MDNKKLTVEDLAIFCKKKGFVFRAAEIYGGLSGFFDMGPLGVELKNNIKREWWKQFITKREDMAGQDGSIITNPSVWKASGHVDNFADMILTTKTTKTKLRADHFIEDQLKISTDGMKAAEINALVKKHNLKYKGEEFEEVKDFNLMFATQVGADTTKNSTAFLRPETAQSIFPNFRVIMDVSRGKLPFGIAQIGKAFRNEISPRDFVFRCREFEQMEIEYFFNPNAKCEALNEKHKKVKVQLLSAQEQDNKGSKMVEVTIGDLLKKGMNEYQAYWLAEVFLWFRSLGLSYENLRVREHVKRELSHYSSATFDIDYNYPFGFKEMFGLAHRGDYDLKQHQQHSKTNLDFFDEASKTKVLPNVMEPSFGVERLMMALLCEAYTYYPERENVVLKFLPKMAPVKVAVFPLMNKDELTSVSRKLFDELRDEDIEVVHDHSGSIGKRYARQDEMGTPYCITVDYETLEEGPKKGTVTIRERDGGTQKRVEIEGVSGVIISLIKGRIDFKDL